MTEAGLEYDVPARSRISGAEFALDADGTPVVMGQVEMNYGTRGQRGEWDARYVMRNVQSIAYTQRNASWEAHSFRNIQGWNNGSPSLIRNASGGLQALVQDGDRFSLFARAGSGWALKSRSGLNNLLFYGFGSGSTEQPMFSLLGDSAWQVVTQSYEKWPPTLEAFSSTGARLVLDTGTSFGSMGYFHGETADLVVGEERHYNETGFFTSSLVCYSWSRGNPGAKPAKIVKDTLLDTLLMAGVFLRAKVLGEERLYIPASQDSLGEFALRGDAFVRLAGFGFDIAEPAFPPPSGPKFPDSDTAPPVRSSPYPDGIDENRCLHWLTALKYATPDPTADPYAYSQPISFIHTTSCSNLSDTLAIPERALKNSAYIRFSRFRFSARGEPMILITSAGNHSQIYARDAVIGPSLILLAKLSPSAGWEVETVAEY